MINKSEIFHKISFTLHDLLEVTKTCDNSTKVYNSCYTPEYTKTLLDNDLISCFGPISGLYEPGNCILAVFSFDNKRDPITLQDLKNFITSDDRITSSTTIQRDVEDGYVYEEYDNIIFNKHFIILC